MRMVQLALLAVLLTSCNPPSSSPGVAQTDIPDEAPSICGIITELSANSVLVEEHPRAESGSAKAMMHVQEGTRVLHRDGSAASYAALAVGQTISAWFDGPVAESYPVQAAAGIVVLEGLEGCD